MEWNEELISRLRALWQEGLSTAEIGRQLEITKNAVVGKAHRLGLPPRPSPIRRQPEAEGAAAPARAAAPKAAPKPAVVAEAPAQPVVAEAAPAPVVEAAAVVAPAPVAAPEAVAPRPAPKPEVPVEAPRPVLRAVSAPAAPRRSGLTCCWPLGEPGTKDFHFCGGTPIPGKPYCAEHAQLAYVKLRDRRDNVA